MMAFFGDNTHTLDSHCLLLPRTAPARYDSANDSILRQGYGRSYQPTASVTLTSANL